MQDKIQILIKQLKIEGTEDAKYLESAQLKKVIVEKEKKTWTFEIETETMFPVEVFLRITERMKDAFPNLNAAYLHLQPKAIDHKLVNEYWTVIVKNLVEVSPMLELFLTRPVKLVDHKLIVEVHNKVEEHKMQAVADRVEEMYRSYGLPDIEVECLLNEDKGKELLSKVEQEVKQEIEKKEEQIKRIAEKKEVEEVIVEKVEHVKKEYTPNNQTVIFGRKIKEDSMMMEDIHGEENGVVVEGFVFGVDTFEFNKDDRKFNILTVKITDYTNSLFAKIFLKEDDIYNELKKTIKEGKWFKMRGNTKQDKYAKDLVLNIRDIEAIEPKSASIQDDAEEKRVELHTHTQMSQMDGINSETDIIKRAKKYGHQAIAITDHNSVQSFPKAYHQADGIKVIYGVELSVVDDGLDIVFNKTDANLLESTWVVFDTETTGFNAGGGDSMIEIGAVKLKDGEIIDRFDELINPGRKLPQKITELTAITDEMLADKDTEENVTKRFKDWIGDLPMVAHNAKFDISFIDMAYQKYGLGKFNNTVVDTLELSRALDREYARHSLSALVKRYQVQFDEDSHHRADYDAEGTALVYHKMLKKLETKEIYQIDQLDSLVDAEETFKQGNTYHLVLLAQNNPGLKNLFEIVSLANTKYLYKTPRILRSEITKYRDGILIGSGCYEGEVFSLARTKTEEELLNIMKFYDYIEIQPPSVYGHLVQSGDIESERELHNIIEKIIKVARMARKPVCATGDVHHLDKSDKIYREIIVNQKVPGGGRHPLARKNITSIPSQHFMTTNEMLEEFSFLDPETAKEIVITNPNKIADKIEEVKVIKDKLYPPKIKDSDKIVTEMVYNTAHEMYGDPLPQIVADRLEQELNSIIGNKFDVIYLISQKLVKKSNDDGYLVGSRGSVGSSLVATMMGITEVNALAPHYVCPNCKKSIFEEDGKPLGATYLSGYDLPDRVCDCGTKMRKEGQDMPFATFLGFNGDKVPDIDLNFSGEYQWQAHDFTKVVFGEDKAFRAGTIGTVAEKTAFGYVLGYLEEKGITKGPAEIERLARGCTGIKRTTGQHPGGIIVIDKSNDITDFTPYQYPADDTSSRWFTTHFDFHAIDENVLKLDILGHDDPTVLKLLGDISGFDIKAIPFDDKDVLSIFKSPEILGVTSEQIGCPTGTLGIPEFGTDFVIGMLVDTKPTTFSELIKISGLSHGTDVWLGNAQELIKNNICEFKDVIGCRDDIMVYLMYNGLEPLDAFKIMEFVRKGKASKDPETWKKWEAKMREKEIVEWYIDSCHKIKYMFPKAHATAYVMMGLRVAWFKVHHPLYYYLAYFSVRCGDFDIEAMIKGYDAIKDRIQEIREKGHDASNKEVAIKDVLRLAQEASARGFTFANLDLYKSDAKNFVQGSNDHELIPPFRTIDGLGETVALKIVEEREKKPFLSIEELQTRAKVSATLIEKMRALGMLEGMPESNQLSLF